MSKENVNVNENLAETTKEVSEQTQVENQPEKVERVITEEEKQLIIDEYVKKLLQNAPKVNLASGGSAISSPKSKPKNFTEAAEYTMEKLNNNK